MTTNMDTAKALYDAFNRQDMPAIMALLDPAITWISYAPDFALARGTYNGKDGVGQFFKDLMTQQTDKSFEPQEFYEGDGTVHAMGVETGSLNDSGLEFVNHWDHTFWFAEDNPLVVKFRCNYQLSTSGTTA
jgi:ketosteroid isomerase-like protein